jgi:hypothetical protein
MGKHFNAEVLRQLERQAKPAQDDEPLTEFERAAQFDDFYWDRLDTEVRFFGGRR